MHMMQLIASLSIELHTFAEHFESMYLVTF